VPAKLLLIDPAWTDPLSHHLDGEAVMHGRKGVQRNKHLCDWYHRYGAPRQSAMYLRRHNSISRPSPGRSWHILPLLYLRMLEAQRAYPTKA
jgi:hypothetical protein